MEKPIIIGIAGGTGSGKTTLVNKLKDVLGNEVVALTHDYYYKANDHLEFEERKMLNYDHPNAFDTDILISDLIKLKNGESIQRPIYSFVKHTREEETVTVKPKKVIIIEGILIFENKDLRDLLDIKVYVDTDADVRIIRRVLRDVKERGRSLDSVISRYLNTVKIMHEEFVEPSKKHADIIIPEGGYNEVACSMLIDKIRVLLNE
ncbi:uridine kinase [Vallitalea sp.]|uniref:uridine kinase n=1 Tax=Vallitalea sp. TaxID=1882829 RepID=UPI0025E3A312|nr:uridine kinase [Vallitalea sp.]MCT4686174.1 uridine kinase [Vallitalea sp.]